MSSGFRNKKRVSLLYCLVAERRTETDYDDNRKLYLSKPQKWTNGAEIKSVKDDPELIEYIIAYRTLKRMGLPYPGGFASQPAWVVELMETLGPLDDLYHPSMRLG